MAATLHSDPPSGPGARCPHQPREQPAQLPCPHLSYPDAVSPWASSAPALSLILDFPVTLKVLKRTGKSDSVAAPLPLGARAGAMLTAEA